MASREETVAGEALTQRERQVVVFSLGQERYGVDISTVRRIIPIQKIVPVPRCPDFVEGIINLRGRIIPVLDLRRHFGLERRPRGEDERIVWVELGADSVGVIVDSVSSVTRIPEDSIQPAAHVVIGPDVEYIEGIAKIGDDLVILLDLTRIIKDAEKEALRESDLRASVVQ